MGTQHSATEWITSRNNDKQAAKWAHAASIPSYQATITLNMSLMAYLDYSHNNSDVGALGAFSPFGRLFSCFVSPTGGMTLGKLPTEARGS